MHYCSYCCFSHGINCVKTECFTLSDLNAWYNHSGSKHGRDLEIDDAVAALVLTLREFLRGYNGG